MTAELISIAKTLAHAVANKDYSDAVVDAGFFGRKSLTDAVSQGFFNEEGNLHSQYRSTYPSALERTKFQQIPSIPYKLSGDAEAT